MGLSRLLPQFWELTHEERVALLHGSESSAALFDQALQTRLHITGLSQGMPTGFRVN